MNLKGFGMNGLIKGKEVHFDEEYLHVTLEDNRIISTPIEWYEPLKKATIEQLKDYKYRYRMGINRLSFKYRKYAKSFT